MNDDEVIARYMRRFDRAVGAEPAALNELVESFSDDAVVNFDGTPHTGRARLLELYGRVLGPLVETCTHFTPEQLSDGTIKVPANTTPRDAGRERRMASLVAEGVGSASCA